MPVNKLERIKIYIGGCGGNLSQDDIRIKNFLKRIKNKRLFNSLLKKKIISGIYISHTEKFLLKSISQIF